MCLSRLPSPQIKQNLHLDRSMQKPPRPYSEYNLFFQLEREYILQELLGVKPIIEPSEIFSSDDELYKGPPLPSKYQDLILCNDWYIPGKSSRRNRRHRKSHGKIGFLELSNKIAESWARLDDETRVYCAVLSDIGMLKYKADMRAYKMANSTQCMPNIFRMERKPATKKDPKVTVSRSASISSESSQGRRESTISQGNSSEGDMHSDVRLYLAYLESNVMAQQRTKTIPLCDIDDDEIRRLWVSEN